MKLKHTKAGNKANKNCILLSIHLAQQRYFFSIALLCALSHAKWKVFRDKQPQTMAIREKGDGYAKSKLDTMETTFVNCLSVENNDVLSCRKRERSNILLFVTWFIHNWKTILNPAICCSPSFRTVLLSGREFFDFRCGCLDILTPVWMLLKYKFIIL